LKRYTIVLCLILAVVVVGLGCLPAKPAATTPIVSAKDTEQDAEISKIKSSITSLDEGKASKSSINDLSDRVSKINQATTDLSGYYKKAEVDAAIVTAVNSAIANLKNEKPWATGSSSGGGVAGGVVTFKVKSEPSNMVYDDGSYTWWIEITNGNTEYKKCYVIGFLNYTDNHSGDVVAWTGITDPLPTTSTYLYSPDLSGGTTNNPNGVFSMSFVPSVSAGGESTGCTQISGTSQGYVVIKGGDTKLIPVTLKLDYVNPATRWSATWSISAQKYP
jgi:hypothetical protein